MKISNIKCYFLSATVWQIILINRWFIQLQFQIISWSAAPEQYFWAMVEVQRWVQLIKTVKSLFSYTQQKLQRYRLHGYKRLPSAFVYFCKEIVNKWVCNLPQLWLLRARSDVATLLYKSDRAFIITPLSCFGVKLHFYLIDNLNYQNSCQHINETSHWCKARCWTCHRFFSTSSLMVSYCCCYY